MNLAASFSDFVSLLFPRVCLVCQKALPHQVEHICVKCRYDLPKTNNHNIQIDTLHEKFQNIIDLSAIYVYCHFHKGGKLQRILHAIKYHNQQHLARILGKWYTQELVNDLGPIDVDIIVPVPLHPKRLKQRGFNQSERIAEGVADVLGKPIISNLIVRSKMNTSLTRMSKKARIETMRSAYVLNNNVSASYKGQKILLVDDVLTTGSTLIACHEALEEIKPNQVSALVLAAAQ